MAPLSGNNHPHRALTIAAVLLHVAFLAAILPPAVARAQTTEPGVYPLPVVVPLDPQGDQYQPSAALDGRDRLMTAWHDSSSQGDRIIAQGFDRKGGRIGVPRVLTSNQFRGASRPSVAAYREGRAVVAWEERALGALFLRRLDFAGRPLHALPMPRLDLRMILGASPAVAADSAGAVVLVWESGQPGSREIMGAWFSATDTLGTVSTDTFNFAWNVPALQLNTTTDGDQSDPAVALDPRYGDFVVAWRNQSPDSLGIVVKGFSIRGQAGGEFRLPAGDSLAARAVSAPAIAATTAVYDSSYFVVSWVEEDFDLSRHLYLALVSQYTRLGQEAFVADSLLFWEIRNSPGLSLERPAVSANSQGEVVLAWNEDVGGGAPELYSLSFQLEQGPLQGQSGPVRITSANQGHSLTAAAPPNAAMRTDGSYLLLWEDDGPQSGSPGDIDILMQSFTFAGLVEEPLPISPAPSQDAASSYPALAALPDSGFIVLWEGSAASGRSRLEEVPFLFDGRISQPPFAPFASSPDWEQRRPVMAVDSAGLVLAAWQEQQDGQYRLRAAWISPEAGHGEPVTLEESSTSHLSGASVALGPAGAGWVAWERWAPLATAPELRLARLDSLGTRLGSTITVASAAGGGGQYAALAVAGDGRCLVTWRQGSAAGGNAAIRAAVYGPQGQVVRAALPVSAEALQYLGAIGRPAAAWSEAGDWFAVLWQEFHGERQRLYYRLFSSAGDSLALASGEYRRRFDPLGWNEQTPPDHQTSPVVTATAGGGLLALWVELATGQRSQLVGLKLGADGAPEGGVFRVPGVEELTLPAAAMLGGSRLAVAWQDTVGDQARLLARVLELRLYTLLGSVRLEGAQSTDDAVWVQLAGAARDSVPLDGGGGFALRSLVAGEYSLWLSRAGRGELPGTRRTLRLSGGDRDTVRLGVLAELETGGPELPRAAGPVLYQNRPNPFNPSTTISFELNLAAGERQEIRLQIFDLRGALVATLLEGSFPGGRHSAEWNGRDANGRPAASGIYLCRLTAGGESRLRKLVLLK